MNNEWLTAINCISNNILNDLSESMVDTQDKIILDAILKGLSPIYKVVPSIDTSQQNMFEVHCNKILIDWLKEERSNSVWFEKQTGPLSIVCVDKELLSIILLKFK